MGIDNCWFALSNSNTLLLHFGNTDYADVEILHLINKNKFDNLVKIVKFSNFKGLFQLNFTGSKSLDVYRPGALLNFHEPLGAIWRHLPKNFGHKSIWSKAIFAAKITQNLS